jgi:serine/threonine-protein kinase HipA
VGETPAGGPQARHTVKTLIVHYNGWGEHWPLGTLADNGRTLLFEYSKEALAQQLELSPLHLTLRAQAYGDFPLHQDRLPGLIADSLPDGWGRLLMDKIFRRQGFNPAELSPLDRLAVIGDRGMGALSYAPANMLELTDRDLSLLELATDAQAVVHGDNDKALLELARLGGSPHGARPKVLVYFSTTEGTVSTLPRAGHTPWLIKFNADAEHKETCAIEQAYAELARECGLEIPQTRYFDLSPELAAFGAERFDIEGAYRVPTQTLAAVFDADFRIPSVLDYTKFLRITDRLSNDQREVKKAYERALFNVIFHNRDDHSKNISFRLGQDRRWRLAPAYDLTFSEGYGGEHSLDVCGEGRQVTRANLLELAKQAALPAEWAVAAIDRISSVAVKLKKRLSAQSIRKATVAGILAKVNAGLARL